MPTTASEQSLLRMLTWLSPAFPVGGFSFSHGLELAVEAGLVTDGESLRAWIEAVLEHGAGWVDAILLAHCWRAASRWNEEELVKLAILADCQRATAELAVESQAQGRAFLVAVRAAWPEIGLDRYVHLLARIGRPPAYACAVGVATALAGIAEETSLVAYLHAFAANLISAGVRLIPLGQQAGLRVLASLEPAVLGVARRARAAGLDELGTASWLADWTSARHETQYTRLFRS